MSDPGPVVQVRDLWMSFPGKKTGEAVHVLERVDLEVRRGEFVCVIADMTAASGLKYSAYFMLTALLSGLAAK